MASDPRISAPIALEAERNHIRRTLSAGQKFNSLLAQIGITPVPAGKEFYVKQGLYRGGAVAGRTAVVWIGPTARGGSFAAVEQRAFGTAEGIKNK